jgi:hypothetical protein
MKYSNHSITGFLNELYDLNKQPFGYNEISSVEMYQFIKEKSNNFDLVCFEYLIQDIRNYHQSIQFELKNPEPEPEIIIDPTTGYPTYTSEERRDKYKRYITYDLSKFSLEILLEIDLDITDDLTLRERIKLFQNRLPEAVLLHHISDLLKFSDIAEKEFSKVTSSKLATINNSTKTPQKIQSKNSLVHFPVINKDNFIDLIGEVGKLMPDIDVRRHFLEKRFTDIGYTLESGYKQTSYFYNELKKARDEQESIYKGRCIKTEETFGLVDSTCYLKMYYKSFENLEELFNSPVEIYVNQHNRIDFIPKSNVNDEPDEYVPTLQTIWKSLQELTEAHRKLKKILNCDINTWLYWFGGIPLDNPKKIKWIYKNNNKRALTYLVEKISLSKSIDFASARKIFDVKVYNKDKYQCSFKDIDNLLD